MKKVASLLLIAVLILSSFFSLFSCYEPPLRKPETPENGKDKENTIIVPQYKDYQRGTIDFDKITYKRPDITAAIEIFSELAKEIEKNDRSFEEYIALIEEAEVYYLDILTMAAYSNILASRDSSDIYWTEEYKYISTNYSEFAQSIEEMFVAAANSPFAERFENEYFGEGLIEEYKDGGDYTDKIVQLLAQEAELESDYSSLSTATVIISYEGKTDNVDNILSYYSETYGENSQEYKDAQKECQELFESTREEKEKKILVDLFKVRRLISDEFGYDSYATFAYENIYHDYSPSDMKRFTKDVANYVLPVYIKLANSLFYTSESYYDDPEKLDRAKLINTSYDMLCTADLELAEIYTYMLQHKLYDINPSAVNRFDGAFTTYLDTYNAPFIFISTEGNTNDYTTMMHEFGHFADYYINNAATTSLDLSEVSSQGLEFLTLTLLEDKLSNKESNRLLYYEMENVMLTLIFQSFYALFEHKAYEIEYDDISEATLNAAVASAAKEIGLNSQYYSDIGSVLIPHIFLYPFYVQSYCTSASVSLQLYFMEIEEEGAGFKAYKQLISRTNENLTFEEYVSAAGLSSPFEKDILKELADNIHYRLLGSHYFNDSISGLSAA